MAQFTLLDLLTPVSAAEVEASIYGVLTQLGVSHSAWRPGVVTRTLIKVSAIVLAALSLLISLVAKMGFLELSSGQWLTLTAKHVYALERDEATFATGSVTLTNAGGGLYLLDPGDLIVTNPTTGKTYANTASVSIGAGQTVSASVRATEAGSASNALGGTITAFQTPLLGVFVTNPLGFLSSKEESDDDLRDRCRAYFVCRSP
jgi:uncharacterized phage protein gp47/JayE